MVPRGSGRTCPATDRGVETQRRCSQAQGQASGRDCSASVRLLLVRLQPEAGREVRRPPARAATAFRAPRGPDDGAWDWIDDRAVFCGVWRADEAAAVAGCGAPGDAEGNARREGAALWVAHQRRLPGVAGEGVNHRRDCRVVASADDALGRRRSGAHSDDGRLPESVPSAGCASAHRFVVHGRRRQREGGGALGRLVAAALRRRSGCARSQRPLRWPALHRRRSAAGFTGVSRPAVARLGTVPCRAGW